MTELNEREKLAIVLWNRVKQSPNYKWIDCPFIRKEEYLINADFIIEDRKRICAPLINLEWDKNGLLISDCDHVDLAIDSVLKLAGLEKE